MLDLKKKEFSRAPLPGEPVFTLMARDDSAPELLKAWAHKRMEEIEKEMRPIGDLTQCRQALELAEKFKEWREKANFAWRNTELPMGKEHIGKVVPAAPYIASPQEASPGPGLRSANYLSDRSESE